MPSTRKLAALVFIDVVSYTSMMGKDEQATLRLLEELRKVLYPLAGKYGGTVLKELGDGALMSFDSALEATLCSVELQRNVQAVPNLRLRIGIHIGDVVVGEKDVFGSGVNVAARVQPLAAPGGIVVTEDVWNQIKNHPGLSFVPLGSRRLKGVSTPVRVLAVRAEGLSVPDVRRRVADHPAFRPALALLGMTVLAVLSYLFVPEIRQLTEAEVPSIAILYLKNLGPETDEPYTYGITQDLIVDVAKAGLIRVAPMKDILSFQKTDLAIEQIAENLRVRYVMEGSLRREGDIFRLTAQIVEASTGRTLWADRIQARTEDAAVLQGRLADTILTSLQVRPSEILIKEITKPRTARPEAYEFYLRGKYLFDTKKNKQDVSVARGLYERALDLDSVFVRARIGLGKTYELEGEYERAQSTYEAALSQAQRIIDKVDEATSLEHIGGVRMDLGQYDEAVEYFSKSLVLFQELQDHDGQAKVLNNLGIVSKHRGDFRKAIDYFSQSANLARRMGYRRMEAATLLNTGTVHHAQDRLAEALDHYNRALAIFGEVGDQQASGILLTNIGVLHQNLGEYQKALEYFARSLAMVRSLGDRRSEVTALLNIGVVHDEQGDLAQALHHYSMGLQIAKDIGDRRNEGQALLNIGTIHAQQENQTKALEYYERSLAIRRQLSDQPGEAEVLGYMGKLYAEQGKFDKAVVVLTKAADLFKELEETELFTWSTSWLVFARTKSAATRDNKEATRVLVEGLLASVSTSAYSYSEVLFNISRVYALIGDSQKYDQYLEQAYRSVETRARKISDPAVRQMFLENPKSHRDIVSAWKARSTP